MRKKRRLKKRVLIPFIIIVILVLIVLFMPQNNNKGKSEKYISGSTPMITLYDLEYKESNSISRGTLVNTYKFKEKKGDDVYTKIKYNDEYYFETR